MPNALKPYWRRNVSQYKGFSNRCAPGTHEAAISMLQKRGLCRGSVLDLAAGTGALLARLRDSGMSDLNAIELDTPVFRLPGVTPQAVDLNTEFSKSFTRRFGMVTAVEIIEHLDSPRHFLRQIWQLLEPDGYLLISTPNVAHWVGRIWFLLRGELRYFKERDYHHQRHVSPINHTHMRLMLAEIGFRVIDFRTAGSFYGPLKQAVTAPAAGLFRLLGGPLATGDTTMYLCQRTTPDQNSPGRSSTVYTQRYHGDTRPAAGAVNIAARV